MKALRRVLSLSLPCLAGCILGLQAQETHTGWYLRTDLGATHVMRTDVREFVLDVSGWKIEFDTGVRFGIAGGYQFLPWLAVELETGVLVNGVDKLNGQSIDATFTQVPFLATVVLQYNGFGRFVPFLGGGGGGVASVLDIDQRFTSPQGDFWLDGAASDIVPAYHALGGFRYDFHPRMGVGLTYRFLGTGGPSWDVENRWVSRDQQIKFGKVHTHAVTAQFNLQF